ncbi:D-alanyl-D-alanine carboxypeptidase [Streptomyces spectabilis]|uniref:D-alanyl-D-alanine carboxypeptidase n=1 Tax=Streptomyces spectabilis TaxID=68270 RepID=UPI0033FE52FE
MAKHGEYGEYEEESVAGEYPDSSKTVSGGGASEDDAAASPPTPPKAKEANGDARLRNAVAAWVASADAEGDEAEAEGDARPAGGRAGGVPAGGDVSAEADAAAEDADEADDEADDKASSKAESTSVGEPKSDTATAVFRTDRPRVETSDDDKAEGDESADESSSKTAAGSAGEPKTAEAAQVETSGDGESKSDTATAVFRTDRPRVETSDDDKADAGEPPADRATAVLKTVPSWAKKDAAEAEGSAGAAGQSESATGADDADERPVDQATAVFKAVLPDADAKSEAKADAKAKSDAEADATDKPGGTDKPDATDKPVDQATAVFKAVKPTGSGSGAGVDQPTTMLKLGDTKGEKPKAESESERTSKFVALKPLDEPRATPERKAPPQGAPKAPAASAAAPAAPQAAEPAAPEPTTQQPLPPKPPLDLLAELTNTPPPAETPTRTLVRRFKIWTPLVALLAIVFAVVQAVRPLPDAKLTMTAKDTFSFGGGKPSIPWPADGQAAMDVDGIGTFGSSGKAKPVPIASIAKVMTTYLILRDHPIKKGTEGKTLTVDAEAQRHYEKGKPENESVVKVTEGQKIKQYEALQAVMLPSANNVARMLARWDSGGDEKKFVAKMNETAKELGMTNTHYTDPSGLDKTTVSTAEDLVKLGRVAMENPTFKEIARQPKYDDLNGDEQKNYFGLVPTVAIGIKTGTTTAAGGNILFAAEKRVGGKTHVIIGAALAQFGKPGVANIDQVTNVVKDLISGGQDALTAKTVVKKGTVVGHVDDGLGGETPVVTTKDVTAVGWSGLTAKLELGDGGKKVPHTAKKGTKVGVLSVGDGTNGAIKVPVALGKDLAEPGLGAKLTRIG